MAGFLLSAVVVRKLKYRMTNESFNARFEWKLHAIFILYDLAMAIWCMTLNLFKPMFSRSFCQIGYTPPGCQYFPEVVGECENNSEPKGADLVENISSALLVIALYAPTITAQYLSSLPIASSD